MKKALLLLCCLLTLLLGACKKEKTEDFPIVEYMQEHWANYAPFSYDERSATLTVTLSSTLSYDDACAFGASVYCDTLAPVTYVELIKLIGADLMANLGCDEMRVVAQCKSTDGQTIFSVTNGGAVETCWEESEENQ